MKTLLKGNFWILAATLLLLSGCKNVTDQSQSSETYDFTFAFLTDIHVEKGKNADKGFQKAIRNVNDYNPDFVITGGDLVADALGQNEEVATGLYDLYTDLEKGFNMSVYNTMGNHEVFGLYKKSGVHPDHPLYGEKMFEERIGKPYFAFDTLGWRFYILNSVDETTDRQYIGYVDSAQLDWLKADLATVDPNTPIVISTHIPLITAIAQIGGGAMASNSRGLVVENSKAVLDLFRGHNLKLVLQGHLHILEDVYITNIHFITGGAVCAKWWEGPKSGLEEGYILIKVKGEDFDWEYIDYGWEV